MHDLGTLGGASSQAYGVNDRGQIVGIADNASFSQHAFLYSNGRMHDLGTLGGGFSKANNVNNRGQIVGVSTITGFFPVYAFLYTEGQLLDLNDLLIPNSGWILDAATGINETGQICGNGRHNGQNRAFLLTPKH